MVHVSHTFLIPHPSSPPPPFTQSSPPSLPPYLPHSSPNPHPSLSISPNPHLPPHLPSSPSLLSFSPPPLLTTPLFTSPPSPITPSLPPSLPLPPADYYTNSIAVMNSWKVHSLAKNKWFVLIAKSHEQKQFWMEAIYKVKEKRKRKNVF